MKMKEMNGEKNRFGGGGRLQCYDNVILILTMLW
jgi:hypothetical protein